MSWLTRSRLARAGCVLALAMSGLTVGGAAATAAPAPALWPSSNYNAAASRANLAESTIGLSNIASVKLAWSLPYRKYTKARCAPALREPAISGSRVIGVINGVLSSYDLATGTPVWQRTDPLVSGSFTTYLAVSHGLIVLADQDCGDGSVYRVAAFRESNGAPVWNHVIDGESVEVSGSTVITKSEDAGAVTAWRLDNGTQIWRKHAPDEKCSPRDADPRIVAGLVLSYVCDSNSAGYPVTGVRARDVSTGAVRWQKPGSLEVVGGASDTDPNTNIYLSNLATGPRVIAVDPHTGNTRFALVSSTAGPTSPPAITGDRVYSPCYQNHSTRRDLDTGCAFDATTGALLWKRTYADSALTDFVYANGVLIDFNGDVLDAATGDRISTLPIEDIPDGMIIGDGHIGGNLFDGNGAYRVFAPPAA